MTDKGFGITPAQGKLGILLVGLGAVSTTFVAGVEDIAEFKSDNGCDRLVIVWAASTEIYLEESAVHASLEAFEKGLYDSDPAIAPSMIYAYAALRSGVPFANGAPNLSVDIPAMTE